MIRAIDIFTPDATGGRVDVGALAASTETMVFLYDIAPGAGSCPYHYEYVDEWMLVVQGTVVVRTPDGEHTLDGGQLVRFPAGPSGAHKIMNRSDAPSRTLLFSSASAPAVSVYPDSDKIAVWPGQDANDLVFVRDSAVAWSDGEPGWDRAD